MRDATPGQLQAVGHWMQRCVVHPQVKGSETVIETRNVLGAALAIGDAPVNGGERAERSDPYNGHRPRPAHRHTRDSGSGRNVGKEASACGLDTALQDNSAAEEQRPDKHTHTEREKERKMDR